MQVLRVIVKMCYGFARRFWESIAQKVIFPAYDPVFHFSSSTSSSIPRRFAALA